MFQLPSALLCHSTRAYWPPRQTVQTARRSTAESLFIDNATLGTLLIAAMSSSRLSTLATRQLRVSRNSCLQVCIALTVVYAESLTQEQPLTQRASLRTTTVQNPVSFENAATRTRFSLNSNALTRPSPSRLTLSSQPSGLIRSASSQADAAEVYVAYGMTQKLFEACSSQADYRVPQASQKEVPVPTTEAGEHLGVSDSWWYKGSFRDECDFAGRQWLTFVLLQS